MWGRKKSKRRYSSSGLYRRSLSYEQLEDRRLLTTFDVSVFDLDLSAPQVDTGALSLRAAINAANSPLNPGIDTVRIPFSGQTIQLQSSPIQITEPVIIRSDFGQTMIVPRPGFGPVAAALDFNMNVNGIQGLSQVSGFDISGFTSSGIVVSNLRNGDSLLVTGNRLQNNTANGIEILENDFSTIEISNCEISGNSRGIYVHSASGSSSFNGTLNIIPSITGGRNLIHNNSSAGIDISGFNSSASNANRVTIEKNFIYGNAPSSAAGAGIYIFNLDAPLTIFDNDIGVSFSGTVQANGAGVSITGNNVTGNSTIESNVIAGNTGNGLAISSSDMPNLDVKDNAIGLDFSGFSKPNGANGISILSSSFRKIIGNVVATNGTINGGDGIILSDVHGGTVGTTTVNEGNTLILNQGDGVELRNGSSGLFIEGNEISSNIGAGVHLRYDAGTGNDITDNSYTGNDGLPIELEDALGHLGPNVNDQNDQDLGPNKLQNYAVIHDQTDTGGESFQISVDLDVDTAGTDAYYIELYTYAASGGSGTFVPLRDNNSVLANAFLTVNSLKDGVDATISIPIESRYGLHVGDKIAALLVSTSGINTSEFSPIITLTPRGDYDRDGDVDCGDYAFWKAAFNRQNPMQVPPYIGADGNGDGFINAADYTIWADAYGSLTGHPIGDFNSDDIVDIGDYIVWKNSFGSTTNLAADANCDGTVNAADYTIWRDTFGSMIGAAKFGLLDAAFAPDVAPEVVGFALMVAGAGGFGFTAAAGSGEQLRSVPLASPNSISVTFNQEVTVTQNALLLINLDGAAPSVTSFAYNSESQTATWTFGSSLADGRYLVRLSDSVHNAEDEALDGEFTNPWSLTETGTSTFPSGNGEAGGEFRFRFTILSGDSDHDNIDGATNYQNWQSYEPGMIHVSTTADDYDADLSFGDVSLREAVNYANTATEPTTIDLPAGRYVLTRTGTEDTGTSYNDLDILADVTIVGAGAGATIIDVDFGGGQSSTYRAFEIASSSAKLDLSAVTITGANVWAAAGGGAALVWKQGTLRLTDSAIVDNHVSYAAAVGVGVRGLGGVVTVERCVFTNNHSRDAAIYSQPYNGFDGSLTIGESIFALNSYTYSQGTPNVKIIGDVAKTNLGNNLFDNATGGFFDVVPGVGDYQGTPQYVVTTVLDTFDHTDNVESTSIREAVDLANTTAGVEEIWIPAWSFVLTRDRGTNATDTDVSYGDIDVKDSTILRGVSGLTNISWKEGIVDKLFELVGDSNNDGTVSSADYTLWQDQYGCSGAWEQFSADADDDGDVDEDDYDIWLNNYGHTLQLLDVLT